MKYGNNTFLIFFLICYLSFLLMMPYNFKSLKKGQPAINFLQTKLSKIRDRFMMMNFVTLRTNYSNNKSGWNFWRAIANFFRRIFEAIVQAIRTLVATIQHAIRSDPHRIERAQSLPPNRQSEERKQVIQQNNNFIQQNNNNPKNSFKLESNKFSKLLPDEMKPFFSLKSPGKDISNILIFKYRTLKVLKSCRIRQRG
jgi:hypothetical protein